jgi:hypothetical protein
MNLSIVIPSRASSAGIHGIRRIASSCIQYAGIVEILVVVNSSDDARVIFSHIINVYPGIARVAYGCNSIYSAMNLGIQMSRSDALYFTGDTDFIYIENILACSSLATSAKSVCSGIVHCGKIKRRSMLQNPSVLRLALERNPVHHQGCIYSKSIFEAIGGYSDKFNVMGDYDINLRIRKKLAEFDISICYTSLPFCHFRQDGISAQGMWSSYLESYEIKKQYLPGLVRPLAYLTEVLAFSLKTVARMYSRVFPAL